MKIEAFLKKNMKRIVRLETELDKLFEGTHVYTAVKIQQDMFRGSSDEPKFEIKAYISQPSEWYNLEKFPNMTAMIGQIKHDVKEAKCSHE